MRCIDADGLKKKNENCRSSSDQLLSTVAFQCLCDSHLQIKATSLLTYFPSPAFSTFSTFAFQSPVRNQCWSDHHFTTPFPFSSLFFLSSFPVFLFLPLNPASGSGDCCELPRRQKVHRFSLKMYRKLFDKTSFDKLHFEFISVQLCHLDNEAFIIFQLLFGLLY